jgi:hypothetical protein
MGGALEAVDKMKLPDGGISKESINALLPFSVLKVYSK